MIAVTVILLQLPLKNNFLFYLFHVVYRDYQ